MIGHNTVNKFRNQTPSCTPCLARKEAQPNMDLTQARERIDQLDQQITALLAERFQVVDAVSDYKAKAHGLAVYDPARETAIIARLMEGCDNAFQADVSSVYERLFEISRQRQERRRQGLSQ